ncbi:HmuY family protein [Psychroflexus tropicus]|uniref:HmuY family protein n=1 Tax=Psychroflexus tropicus TaxID=197345 RepID=UPI00037CE80A|nr:HmuY family protein [Psychroflexus tropicus]
MKQLSFTLQILIIALLFSCSDDDNPVQTETIVAFENSELVFSTAVDERNINVVFSNPAQQAGSIEIGWNSSSSNYEEDFITIPSSETGTLELTFENGAEGVSFNLQKLQNPIEGQNKSINFSISSSSLPNFIAGGNTDLEVAFSEAAASSGNFAPEVGGPNQPNQVFVDLSSQSSATSRRDAWDLKFYNGEDFRVKLNGSLFMAAAELDVTDITNVTAEDVTALQGQVMVGTFNPTNMEYIDAPNGNLSGTAISEISATDAENKVYLLNLGNEIGTEAPQPGSVAVAGEARGWKKIRILRDRENYILQHADLDDTDFQEIVINKNSQSSFTHVSLASNEVVQVNSDIRWDLNFTVFTNEIPGAGSYGFTDFIVNNSLNEVKAYMVETSTYDEFNLEQVEDTNFTSDQRGIGSNWRVGGGPNSSPTLKEEVFFVLKDGDENIYKLKFTALTNENGIRGYPAFTYEKLN